MPYEQKTNPNGPITVKIDSDIIVKKYGENNYTVIYGLQVMSGLRYGSACGEVGKAIIHRLTCEGKFDE